MAGPKGMFGYVAPPRDPLALDGSQPIMPNVTAPDFAATSPIQPHAFDRTGTGTRIVNGLGSFATTLAALRGNQGAQQMLAQQQQDEQLALQQRRLDAQTARSEAQLNKPQVHIAADGTVISFDPTTGKATTIQQGAGHKGSVETNYDFIAGKDPALGDQYLRSQANPMTLMTDPSTGAVGFYPKGGPSPAAAPSAVTSKQQYDSLPPGSPYIAPDGSHRVKGGAPSQGGATFR